VTRRRSTRARRHGAGRGDAELFLATDGVEAILDGDVSYGEPMLARAAWQVARLWTWRLWAEDPSRPEPPAGAVRWDGLTAETWTLGVRPDARSWSASRFAAAVKADVVSAVAWRKANRAEAAEIVEELDGYIATLRTVGALLRGVKDPVEAWRRWAEFEGALVARVGTR
jgi:hypothetical protein